MKRNAALSLPPPRPARNHRVQVAMTGTDLARLEKLAKERKERPSFTAYTLLMQALGAVGK